MLPRVANERAVDQLDFGGPPCTFDSSTSVTAATVLFDGTTAAVAGSYHAASTTLYNSQVTFSGGVDLAGCNLGPAKTAGVSEGVVSADRNGKLHVTVGGRSFSLVPAPASPTQ